MATQAYVLSFVLRFAGSDSGTTRQMVSIAAETAEEAVDLARFYRAGLPTGSVCSTTLTDASGSVIWSEQEQDGLNEEDHP